jgi:hypothetical protein
MAYNKNPDNSPSERVAISEWKACASEWKACAVRGSETGSGEKGGTGLVMERGVRAQRDGTPPMAGILHVVMQLPDAPVTYMTAAEVAMGLNTGTGRAWEGGPSTLEPAESGAAYRRVPASGPRAVGPPPVGACSTWP